jgi:hypothetical protein
MPCKITLQLCCVIHVSTGSLSCLTFLPNSDLCVRSLELALQLLKKCTVRTVVGACSSSIALIQIFIALHPDSVASDSARLRAASGGGDSICCAVLKHVTLSYEILLMRSDGAIVFSVLCVRAMP